MRTRAPRALLTSFMQHMLPKIDCGEILGDLGFVKGYLAGKWAIVLAFMICTMHYALTASTTAISDEAVALPTYVIPAKMLGFAVVGAVLLVMGSGFSTYIIDLRSSTELADRIHQLSFNDLMTELPNRISFNERLSFDAAEAHEKAHKLATFSINIDGFKDVNDVFGHSAADLLLIEVADRMRRILGRGEFLARQSGDEFLGLQKSGNHPQDAQNFAERNGGHYPDRRMGAAYRLPRRCRGQAARYGRGQPVHAPSLADFIATMVGLRFSVQVSHADRGAERRAQDDDDRGTGAQAADSAVAPWSRPARRVQA